MADSFLNQRTSFILSRMLFGGVVRHGSAADPPSTAVTCFFSTENMNIRRQEKKEKAFLK